MKKLLFIQMLFACYMGMGQKLDKASIIGKPIRIDKLEVAQYNFSKRMNFRDANSSCLSLGEGWRLPTFEETALLDKNRDKTGLEENCWFNIHPKDGNSYKIFGDIRKVVEQLRIVRAVRSI